MNALHRLPLLVALTFVSLFGLSACGSKDAAPGATQIAAKVGSEEISVHQINQILSRTNTSGAAPEAVKALSRQILEKLIDQQLAIDQATDAKLHRSPEVVAQIEAAKRDILARAYLQQLAASLPKPTPEEAKKYIADHPALFTQRRIFKVQELVAPNGAPVADQAQALANAGKPLEDLANLFKDKNIPYRGGEATRAAEQIPLDLLPQIHALKDGQTTVLKAGPGITIVHLVESQNAAVTEAQALPRVEQFLANQRASAAIAEKLIALRAAASISYQGEFAATASTPDSAQKQAPALTEQAQTAIEKGVAGLK